MKAYSIDLRERVLKDAQAGLATAVVATKYSVSLARVRRVKKRAGAGQPRPKAQRRGPVPATDLFAELIRQGSARRPTSCPTITAHA